VESQMGIGVDNFDMHLDRIYHQDVLKARRMEVTMQATEVKSSMTAKG
jgi:hypothetical protein